MSASQAAAPDSRLIEAMRLHAQGKLDEAGALYAALLEQQPKNADLHYNLAVLYLQNGQPREAVPHAEKAYALAKRAQRFGIFLANSYVEAGAADKAIETLETLLAAHPASEDIRNALFGLCIQEKNYEPVLRHTRQMLKAAPKNIAIHTQLSTLYHQLERYEEALPHMAFILAAQPEQDEAFFGRYAQALQRTANLAKALQVLALGLARYPDSKPLLHSKGFTEYLAQQYGEALETYRGAHNAPMAGALELLLSDGEKGYENYAARPSVSHEERDFSEYFTRWSGQSLQGKKLLLWSEQGVGDVVMFAGFIPWLIGQGAAVTLMAVDKLIPLLKRSFPEMVIVSHLNLRAQAGAFDYHLPLGDLTRYGLPHYTPAGHSPYLIPDTDKVRRLREFYAKPGHKRRIGISWHTANPDVGFIRSIGLAQWKPLLSVPGIQFVSLQYGDHQADIDSINRQCGHALLVDHAIDAFGDIDGLAAQICAMDEIITVDNVTVHLAGALGVPATLLLSTMPDWRWGIGHAACRWYKSVTIERQEKPLQWQSVMQRLRKRLL